MHVRAVWLISLAMVLFPAAGANAAMTVLGTSEAVRCFEKADAGSADAEACNDALRDTEMSNRDRASTFVNRGIVYNNARKMQLALADFASALAIDPNIAEAYLNRGNSKFLQNRFDEAIADYTHAIDLKIDRLSAAYYDRSLAYAVKGRLPEAKADLEAALAVDPDFKPAKDQLAAIDRILAGSAQRPESQTVPR